MRDLLLQIVKGIVNNPDQVVVDERESVDFLGLTIYEITVADPDKGILIGRRGRTINAIRDIMTISAIRNEKRIKVLVNEDRGPNGERREYSGNREERKDESGPVESPSENSESPKEDIDQNTEDMLSDEV